MKNAENMRFDTTLQHGGYDPKKHHYQLSEPIYQSAVTIQPDCKTAKKRFEGKLPGHIYGRMSHPTGEILEKRLAMLEGGDNTAAITYGSGMAAIKHITECLVPPGFEIAAQRELYGGTGVYFEKDLKEVFARNVIFWEDPHDLDELEKLLKRKKVRALFLEEPSNPLLNLSDLKAAAKIAKTHGKYTIADTTFLTPVLYKPLLLDADFVIHSLTKWMNLGDTNTGGAIIGSKDNIEKIKSGCSSGYGAPLSPFDAWQCLMGLRTLGLRVRHQSKVALDMAHWLSEETQLPIKWVHYPLLQTEHPRSAKNYELASRYLKNGAGCVVSTEIDGSVKMTRKFVDSLKIFANAVSLGGPTSLVNISAQTTHLKIGAESRKKSGISDTLARFSFGLEDPADLREDLYQGFKKTMK